MLKKCKFIKPNIPFNPKRTDYAPMFRKKFKVEQKVENAYLYVCGLGVGHYYLNGKRVSEDKFVAPKFTWSPRFSYYGFRYIILSGIRDVNQVQVKAVFVHQDVAVRSSFSCSNNKVNQLFQIGQNATLCNMFYSLTDCPTREKLGWMNDAQASIHQILTDFESEKFFGKWFVDICDAMKENGQLPGIVPTGGWGYHWGNTV